MFQYASTDMNFLRQGDPNERGAQERREKHWYHALCDLKK